MGATDTRGVSNEKLPEIRCIGVVNTGHWEQGEALRQHDDRPHRRV